jgi:hypothetical protein
LPTTGWVTKVTVSGDTSDSRSHVSDDSFSQQVNAWNSNYFPSVENGGMGGWTAHGYLADATTADGSGDSSTSLPKTPAHLVALDLGTNDCNSGMQGGFHNNLTGLVYAVMTDQPVLPIPTLPIQWSSSRRCPLRQL